MITINEHPFAWQNIAEIVYKQKKIALDSSDKYRNKIQTNAEYLQKIIHSNIPVYGTTTGFGASCREFVGVAQAKELQKRLIRYHQCGTGLPFSEEQCKAIMTARLVSLTKGYSGVRYELLENLTSIINNGIIPFIPQEGSVGASGDLTPLAYIAAVMEGTGRVIEDGKVIPAKEALEKSGLAAIELAPKEGLAIINGTSVMTGILALSLLKIQKLCHISSLLTAICVQVLKGKKDAFAAKVHEVKPFSGQKKSAEEIRYYLQESSLLTDYREEAQENIEKNEQQHLSFAIQNVYSLRCAPQIIGVVYDSMRVAENWVEIEMNSVSDNPLIFSDEDTVLMGGNFYGGYIAQAADSLKVAICHLADLADKQLALLVDDKFSQGLPANLVVEEMGLNHGFKGMQITASALTAEVLRNATASSIFSRPTESHNQDKVSMGTIATRDLERSIDLTTKVLAVLALAAVQAIDIRGKNLVSSNTIPFYEKIRSVSSFCREDRPMDEDIEKVAKLLLEHA